MPRLPQFDPIEYLVWKRHPDARFGVAAVDTSGIMSPGRREALKAADDYRAQLHGLAKEVLDRLVEEERADDAERDRQKKLADEAARPFNQPQAQADFEYWAKMSVWSVDEAVALSLGRDPRHVNSKLVESYAKVSAFASLFTDRRNLVRRAVAALQLNEYTTPGAFLAWASCFKLQVPDALTKAVDELGIEIVDWKTRYDEAVALVTALREELQQNHDRHMAAVKDHSETIDKFRRHMEEMAAGRQRLMAGKDGMIAGKDRLIADQAETIAALTARVAELEALSMNKSLGTRERESLLKLVIGLAMDGYGYDPKASRSPIAREIAGHLALLKLSIDEDTVRKYLNEAKDLISTDEIEP